MPVMFDVTNPVERGHTMAKSGGKNSGLELKELLSADGDFLRAVMDVAVQAVLEAEMTEALSAEKSARVEGRQGYRSGYHSRSLTTRVGTLELRVPRDRSGTVFHRIVRTLSALGEGVGERTGGDVCAGGLDAE